MSSYFFPGLMAWAKCGDVRMEKSTAYGEIKKEASEGTLSGIQKKTLSRRTLRAVPYRLYSMQKLELPSIPSSSMYVWLIHFSSNST